MSRRRGKRGRSDGFLPDIAAPTRGAPRRMRVERDLRDLLVEVLNQLSDPRLSDVSISRVQLTEDLSFARIFVREGIASGVGEQAMIDGLVAASGRIRREVAQRLQMRRAPELRFIFDAGLEHAARVDELLAEIEQENSDAPTDERS